MPSVMGTMFSLDDLVSPMIVSGVMNVVFLSGVFGGLRCSSSDVVLRIALGVRGDRARSAQILRISLHYSRDRGYQSNIF